MAKLPYIPDKKMYAAVMGACSYVKETGYFNKATKYYADKYGVDVEQVRKYVRTAQGNGQKLAAKKRPRKYRWYAIAAMKDAVLLNYDLFESASLNWTEDEKNRKTFIKIVKATSRENAVDQINPKLPERMYYQSHIIVTAREIIACETESEAQEGAEQLKAKYYTNT